MICVWGTTFPGWWYWHPDILENDCFAIMLISEDVVKRWQRRREAISWSRVTSRYMTLSETSQRSCLSVGAASQTLVQSPNCIMWTSHICWEVSSVNQSWYHTRALPPDSVYFIYWLFPINHLIVLFIIKINSYHSQLLGVSEFCFTSRFDNIATEGNSKSGLSPTLIEWCQGFFKVHSSIDSTAHFLPLNSLEHWICATTMTNIRSDQDSNPVHLVSSHNRIEWATGAGQLLGTQL